MKEKKPLTEDTSTQEPNRFTTGEARRMAYIAENIRGWHVDVQSVRQLSDGKMIAWATYRGKPLRVIMDTYGALMALTQEECQLLGVLALEVWPEEC